MIFVKNLKFFYPFILGKRPENVFKNILERKEAFPDDKNNYLKEVENLIKKCQFFHLLILDKTGKENVFSNMIKQKNAFQDYKNNYFQKSKNSHFSKRVSPWFWPKLTVFPSFSYEAIYARKMYFMIF